MENNLIGYIGPGLMGSGIIKNLLRNGLAVTVFVDRPEPHMAELTELGATTTASLAELSESCETIMMTLPTSDDVENVVLGSAGLIERLRPGATVIDFSTSLPTSTVAIANQLAERKIRMLDAGMTGGPKQSEQGLLGLIVGGERQVYESFVPVFRHLARNIFYVGPSGCGHTVKLINNFLNLVNQTAVSEILPLAAKQGVDLDALYGVICQGGGNSWVFENKVPPMLARDFAVTFRLALCHKDMQYVARVGRELKCPLPMANAALGVYDLAMAAGMGAEQNISLVKLWEEYAGIEVHSSGQTVANDGKDNAKSPSS